MQLRTKISLVAATLLYASALMADDYVSVQYIQYEESDNRASISSPSIEFSKDFGVDYSLKVGITTDSVSGASPTWHGYDSTSGATAHSETSIHKDDIYYTPIEYDDDREAMNVLFTTRFASRDELSVGVNYSSENDYEARELSSEYLHYLDTSKNRSISAGISLQSNRVEVVCQGNEKCDASSGASELFDVDVISAEVGFTQIIDENSLAKVSFFGSNEDGYLSNPYMKVLRGNLDSSFLEIAYENKPDTRISYGATLQYVAAITENLSSHNNYRFYSDDWDIVSHTLSSELYYELGKKWILGAGLRYYTQNESNFYKSGKNGYFSNEEYASSDERMGNFDAIGYKVNTDYRISKAVSMNVGLNIYDQLDSFNATYYNVGLKYRF